MRTATLLACLLAGLLPAAAAHSADRVGSGFSRSDSAWTARRAVRDTGQHFTYRSTPGPLARCDWFLVFEIGAAGIAVRRDDWVDRTLFSNGAGLMRNVGERDAVGASLDLISTGDAVTLTPTVRWRRFVGRSASVDASLGFVDNKDEGVHGPIARVKYAPIPQVYGEAGVTAFRRLEWEPLGPPNGPMIAHEVSDPAVFGGIGFTGRPAAALWVAEAVAFAVTFVVVMGSVD